MAHFRSILLVASFIGALTAPVIAQSQDSGATPTMPANKTERMQHAKENMMGKHMMKATVSSVDKQTGIVKVNASGMDLTVHFPPDSLATVNPNDTINLYLGFSK